MYVEHKRTTDFNHMLYFHIQYFISHFTWCVDICSILSVNWWLKKTDMDFVCNSVTLITWWTLPWNHTYSILQYCIIGVICCSVCVIWPYEFDLYKVRGSCMTPKYQLMIMKWPQNCIQGDFLESENQID